MHYSTPSFHYLSVVYSGGLFSEVFVSPLSVHGRTNMIRLIRHQKQQLQRQNSPHDLDINTATRRTPCMCCCSGASVQELLLVGPLEYFLLFVTGTTHDQETCTKKTCTGETGRRQLYSVQASYRKEWVRKRSGESRLYTGSGW